MRRIFIDLKASYVHILSPTLLRACVEFETQLCWDAVGPGAIVLGFQHVDIHDGSRTIELPQPDLVAGMQVPSPEDQSRRRIIAHHIAEVPYTRDNSKRDREFHRTHLRLGLDKKANIEHHWPMAKQSRERPYVQVAFANGETAISCVFAL